MSTPALVPWAIGANVYEVNIRQYTPEGTFQAFSQHLPRLKEMGVAILWLMPITPISQLHRLGTLGSYYACSSYVQINEEFGTLQDFKQLVQQAHALDMKLIIDWVANHTGWDHEWTIPHADWYVKDAAGNFTEKNGWKDVIDLDYSKTEMREAMKAAMKFWVQEADIDGFRCDMAHLVPLDFWKEARAFCETNKPLYWLAECDQSDYHMVFNTSYAWGWMHATEKFHKGEGSLQDVRQVLHAFTQYPAGANKLYFTSNHDENSWNGTEYEKYGNAALAWAVFSCTWPGIPLLYSGQEGALKKRLEFFNKDVIDWTATPSLAQFYQRLFQLRKRNAAIREGELFILPSQQDDKVLLFIRKFQEQVVLILLNVSNESRVQVSVEHPWLPGKYRQLFSQLVYDFGVKENFELQSGDYLVYEKV
ncbi:MAG: alpha-amylase family glycosyl hydrolase [Chitinophagia bacterium]